MLTANPMRRSFLPPDYNSAPGMGAFRIVLLILAFVGVIWLTRSGAQTLSSGVMLLAGPPPAPGSGSGSGALTPAEQAALDGRNRELQARLAAAVAAQQAGSGSGSGSGATP
jgi:hypothetical protein